MKFRLLVRICRTGVVLVMVAGCAGTPLIIPPPSDTARAEFGNVAVGPVRPNSSGKKLQELETDIASDEGEGAWEGIKWAFEPVSEVCASALPTRGAAVACVGTIAYGVVVAPVAAVVGAIRSRPASEVETATRSLLAAFNRMNPRTALRDQIIFAGKSMTGFSFIAIDDEHPGAAADGRTELNSSMTLFFEPFLLFDDDNMNPGVTLEIQLTAFIARATDATPLHTQVWRYWSEKGKFFDLADNGAKHFEEVMAKAYERLARKIVHDVFIASAPETQNPQKRGTAWAVDTSSFYDSTIWDPTKGADAQ